MAKTKKVERIRNHLPSLYERYSDFNRIEPDENLVAEMFGEIQNGMPPSAACGIARISFSVFQNWLDKGSAYLHTPEHDRTPLLESYERYGQFYVDFEHAKSMFQKIALERMTSERTQRMWKRDLALLERRARDEWAVVPVGKKGIDETVEPDDRFL